MGINESLSRWNKTEPFELQVSRGQIRGHQSINIFGYQPLVGTTPIAIWENATPFIYPSSAVRMTITGTDADTSQVLINGLDANYNAISEVIALNGTNGVLTTNFFFRINNMIVIAGNPAATVTATNNGNTYAKINTGIGRTQASIFTVPAGHTFYLNRVNAFSSLAGGSNNFAIYKVKSINPSGTVIGVLQAPFTTQYEAVRVVPFAYAEKTDIQWQCSANTNTAYIGMVIEGILIKNEDA